jgi:hypothetical protein
MKLMNMLTPIAAPSAKPLNKEERLKSEIFKALARLDGGAGFKISRGRSLAEQRQAAVANERATAAKTVADLEQRLSLAGERATAAERKLANAVARERTAARAIADLARTFPQHAPA